MGSQSFLLMTSSSSQCPCHSLAFWSILCHSKRQIRSHSSSRNSQRLPQSRAGIWALQQGIKDFLTGSCRLSCTDPKPAPCPQSSQARWSTCHVPAPTVPSFSSALGHLSTHIIPTYLSGSTTWKPSDFPREEVGAILPTKPRASPCPVLTHYGTFICSLVALAPGCRLLDIVCVSHSALWPPPK